MICDELCVQANIKLFKPIPRSNARLLKPLPNVRVSFYCPENGNYIMQDGSIFITSDNKVFWVTN